MPHTLSSPLEQYQAGINVQGLSKQYGTVSVLENISFSVLSGKSLSVIGKSGCGKSTLLTLLAQLQDYQAGRIEFTAHSGESFLKVHKRMPRLSYVLQEYGLFPWKNATENLMLPLQLAKCAKDYMQEQVALMLQELGLTGLEKRYPQELSGGQKQRLALGRALISKPEIILLDEPFSSVDAINRENLQNLILSLWEKYRFTFVLVTHSVSEAVYLGGNILSLSKAGERRNSHYTLYENPYFAEENIRDKKEYFELCKIIHHSLQKPFAETL
jgi:NitT/TauT family transport system ATP-binding protein